MPGNSSFRLSVSTLPSGPTATISPMKSMTFSTRHCRISARRENVHVSRTRSLSRNSRPSTPTFRPSGSGSCVKAGARVPFWPFHFSLSGPRSPRLPRMSISRQKNPMQNFKQPRRRETNSPTTACGRRFGGPTGSLSDVPWPRRFPKPRG